MEKLQAIADKHEQGLDTEALTQHAVVAALNDELMNYITTHTECKGTRLSAPGGATRDQWESLEGKLVATVAIYRNHYTRRYNGFGLHNLSRVIPFSERVFNGYGTILAASLTSGQNFLYLNTTSTDEVQYILLDEVPALTHADGAYLNGEWHYHGVTCLLGRRQTFMQCLHSLQSQLESEEEESELTARGQAAHKVVTEWLLRCNSPQRQSDAWLWSTIAMSEHHGVDPAMCGRISYATKISHVDNHQRRRCCKVATFLKGAGRRSGFACSDQEIDFFAEVWSEFLCQTGIEVTEVSGAEVLAVYHETPDSFDSCMSDKPYAGMYAANPNSVSCLVARRGGKLLARALVWNTNQGVKVLDKRYPSDGRPAAMALTRYATEQGWDCKTADSRTAPFASDREDYTVDMSLAPWSGKTSDGRIYAWERCDGFPYIDAFPRTCDNPFHEESITLHMIRASVPDNTPYWMYSQTDGSLNVFDHNGDEQQPRHPDSAENEWEGECEHECDCDECRPAGEDRWTCDCCEESFSEGETSHSAFSEGQLQYVCDGCLQDTYSATRASGIVSHHHSDDGEECEQCNGRVVHAEVARFDYGTDVGVYVCTACIDRYATLCDGCSMRLVPALLEEEHVALDPNYPYMTTPMQLCVECSDRDDDTEIIAHYVARREQIAVSAFQLTFTLPEEVNHDHVSPERSILVRAYDYTRGLVGSISGGSFTLTTNEP